MPGENQPPDVPSVAPPIPGAIPAGGAMPATGPIAVGYALPPTWGKKEMKRGEMYGLVITCTIALLGALWLLSNRLFVPTQTFHDFQLEQTNGMTEMKGVVKQNTKEVSELKTTVTNGFQNITDELKGINLTGPNRPGGRRRRTTD